MGSVQLNQNGDCMEDTSMEQLLSPDSSDYNVFGDPELLPRVGDQYQVDIPALMAESERLLYRKSPFEVDFSPNVPSDFLMGLSIPVMWIKGTESLGDSNGKSNKNRVVKSETNKEAQMYSRDKDSKVKFEPVDVACGNGIGSEESENLAVERKMDRNIHMYPGEGYYLIPSSFGESWSDIEEASFLLGLYIFGKNLVQVKKFIESKTMGDVQSFYYGKFYRSDKYRRWSDCRKMRSRKCVYGQRIFTGLRQQELLSRLFSRVSEECQNTLLEVFSEALILVVSYFNSRLLHNQETVVTELTSTLLTVAEPQSLTPPMSPWCPRWGAGHRHACFDWDQRRHVAPSLVSMSVAPLGRLHRERFSRRKLTKGDHYFDSVTDVLSKVALDPGLIELEIEADESNRIKDENGWTNETKLDRDDLSDRRRHCYLQPRTMNHGTDLMKITVVDTSLAGGKTFKVRELKTLPNKVSNMSVSRSDSEESDEDSSKLSSEDSDCVDTMLFDQEDTSKSKSTKTVSDIDTFFDEKDNKIGDSKRGTKGLDSGIASVNTYKELPKFCENKHPKKSLKCSRGMKQDDLDYLAPVTKRRRRLSACNLAETSHRILSFSQNPSLEQEKHIFSSETTDSSENNFYRMGSSQKWFSSVSSSKGSPIGSSEGISCDANFAGHDKPQARPLIDLNWPQVSPDFVENGEVSMGLRDAHENETSKLENSTAPEPSADVPFLEPNMNSRRHSTRNRPLTARALEALANGFLTTTRKRKNKEACPRQNSKSRPLWQARSGPKITESFTSGTVASQMVEVGHGARTDNSDMFSGFQAFRRASGRIRSTSLDPPSSSSGKKAVDSRPPVSPPEKFTGDNVGPGSEVEPRINVENMLEERDPQYDVMLSQMVVRIRSKPGGKLEMASVVESDKRPLPRLRNTTAESGRYKERPVPPGTLNVAQVRHILLLHQGKANDHIGPMDVLQIADKFRVDVHIEKILQSVPLPLEDTSKKRDDL
ncbi:hypothetical protein Acr_03g0018760 [Actinidia rufa]|uniref:SANT domain-containing protein n=1 Tax=Actinidia rufa TaxID=165716 RepID=A0A7J0EFH1_9ERIC|nr:hypothetical protein Acr_03g0018760 [Actinidia rufa]